MIINQYVAFKIFSILRSQFVYFFNLMLLFFNRIKNNNSQEFELSLIQYFIDLPIVQEVVFFY